MPRVIVKCQYYKNTSTNSLGKLMKYIASRKGVEKNSTDQKSLPVSEMQKEFIKQIINKYPDLKNTDEYKYFKKVLLKDSASEFISMAIENYPNLLLSGGYLRYMATRPRVDKINGDHGLFSVAGKELDLDAEAKKLEKHEGNVFSLIVSLKREDAERLGFDKAEKWRDLIRANAYKIAEYYHIPMTNIIWYGAFHNESFHPHIHLLFYSTEKKSNAYLSKRGIENLHRLFGKEIFREEINKAYSMQTTMRNDLTDNMRKEFATLINKIKYDFNISDQLANKIKDLAMRLDNCNGKKQYGYLSKSMKDLVDEIVDDVAENEYIQKLYDLWYTAKCSITRTYTDKIPDKLPLSKEKELKAIRNALIYECLKLSNKLKRCSYANISEKSKKIEKKKIIVSSAMNFIASVSRIFSGSFKDYIGDDDYDMDIDKQLRREIKAVKNGENIFDM